MMYMKVGENVVEGVLHEVLCIPTLANNSFSMSKAIATCLKVQLLKEQCIILNNDVIKFALGSLTIVTFILINFLT